MYRPQRGGISQPSASENHRLRHMLAHERDVRRGPYRARPSFLLSSSLFLGILFAVIATYPLLRVMSSSFLVRARPTLKPLSDAIHLPGFAPLVFNTLAIVLISAVIALILGTALAWLNERTNARMGQLTDSLALVPFLLPPIAAAIGWVLLFSPTAGLANTLARSVLDDLGVHLRNGPVNIYSYYGLIFAYVLFQVPFVFLIVSNGLRNADASLDEQSRVCGVGIIRTAVRVTLPAVRESLTGAWFMMMLQGLSLFSIPLIIGTGARIDIMSVRIVTLLTGTYPPNVPAATGLGLLIVILVGVTWLWQLHTLRSVRRGAIGGKAQRFTRVQLGAWRWPVRAAMLFYGVLALVLPVIALMIVALNGFWTSRISWSHLNVANVWKTTVGDTSTGIALRNSLYLGLMGATIGVLVAALVALFVQGRRWRRVSTVIDGSMKLASMFPPLIMGVGFILAFTGSPFHLQGTILLLLMAYLVLYLPQGAVPIDASISQVGGELVEASAIGGATYGRTFRRVYVPLILSGVVTGWAFLFARMVGDLTASALLAGPTNTVVGFRIMQIFSNGSFGDLASLAIAITVVSAAVVTIVLTVSLRLGRWRRVEKR